VVAHAGARASVMRTQLRALLRVCPTGAIWQITPKEKGLGSWRGQSAAADQPIRLERRLRSRSLPALGMATECIVCESGARSRPRLSMSRKAQVIDSARKDQNAEAAARRIPAAAWAAAHASTLARSRSTLRLRNQHRRKPFAGSQILLSRK